MQSQVQNPDQSHRVISFSPHKLRQTSSSYEAMALRYDTATDDEVVQHCRRSNPNRDIISEFEGGRSVIRISEEAVVKCVDPSNIVKHSGSVESESEEYMSPSSGGNRPIIEPDFCRSRNTREFRMNDAERWNGQLKS